MVDKTIQDSPVGPWVTLVAPEKELCRIQPSKASKLVRESLGWYVQGIPGCSSNAQVHDLNIQGS